MSNYLYGIHDFSPEWASIIKNKNRSGWTVISEGIGDNPNDLGGQNYSHSANFSITPIVRLNYSHHGQGTIPSPDRYNEFSIRCANFVRASIGCTFWQIANEPNLNGERFNGIPIFPEQYAKCFQLCRNTIKSLAGSQHKVLVAAVAPYNVDTGSWVEYFSKMIREVERLGGADGITLHTYSRGFEVSSISSEDKMNPPYENYYNGFRAYRDFLAVVPNSMRHLPVYITETDQNIAWENRNTGWVKAAYREIDDWNKKLNTQKIYCLVLYRWENFDQWVIKTKGEIVRDFEEAVALGLKSPETEHKVTLPLIEKDPPKGVTTEVPLLAHPVQDPKHRRVTQIFGARPEYYKQFSIDGVPLKGHEGIDFGTPTGSVIVAVDKGRVVEAADQGSVGYGKYIKIVHDWGESVYAHLLEHKISLGQEVSAGQPIGISGWSGNVDPPGPFGAHLHFGLRVRPFDRKDGWGGYVDAQPYLSRLSEVIVPKDDKWEKSIAWLLGEEGEFQDYDWDSGNWTGGVQGKGDKKGTKFGITAASYPTLNIRDITQAQAVSIYFRDYWLPSGASLLAWPLCLLVFDTAVLHGVGTAKTWLDEVGENPYLFAHKRLSVYTNSKNWSVAGAGWVNRTARLLREMGTD